ncbi:HU family DNA-binding protein [uncultured Bacteroides sp.]|uniref:HU family DNA-binding protein n=1 Tax=uncultured Bacteroides sp. TaxID=162156 RepID=UPI0025EC9B96|nr:HU family DNA-binding protein [uncultured Bacteroides sp.]
MSAYYDLYETPSPNGKEEKKSLHARICPKETYTKKKFVEHVAMFQHLPKSVIGAALDACIDELCDLLANGNIVELGELGFFSTSLKCTQETDDEKKKIRSESIRFQNVHLRISSTFRKKIRKTMTFERVHSMTKKSKKVKTTEEARKEKLMLFLQENVCITKNEYIQLTGQTKYAAINELNKFIQQGVLRRRGTSRATVYIRQEKASE